MTPYERGYAAALKAAADRCKTISTLCEREILSLPIVGEATNPGEQELPAANSARRDEGNPNAAGTPSLLTSAQQPARPGPSQECVMVPREPKKGLLCGDVAISTDPRYAGWVFVRHVDGINWTTGAKLTPETWAMLAAAKEEHDAHS